MEAMTMNHNICDTITLILPLDKFSITKPEMFSPNADIISKIRHGSFICKNNPSKNQLREGCYYPYLTLSSQLRQGGVSVVLKIQFSAPKLLYGNNFEEVCDSDFEEILNLLQEKLKDMGVETDCEVLKNADVVGIHYGKNIKLNNINASFILQEMKLLDFSKHFDLFETTHKNEGQSVRIHTSFFELCFYDKVKECCKNSYRRCFEEDGIFQDINIKELSQKQILRMEVRLNSMLKIRQTLEKSGIMAESRTFQKLFKSSISQKVNLYFIGKVLLARKSMTLCEENKASLFKRLLQSNHKPLHALQILGGLTLLRLIGVRELISYAGKSKPSFKKLLKEMQEIKADNDWMSTIFEDIQKEIKINQSINLRKEKS